MSRAPEPVEAPAPARRESDRRALVWSLVAYGVGWLAAWFSGFRMVVPDWYFQFLPAELLRDRLGESLLNLHAQPPLLDLLFGLALKLERAAHVPAAGLLLGLQTLLGALAVVALADLLRGLDIGGWRRGAVLALLIANPAFYHFVFLFFQPLYELCLLQLAASGLRRFLARATSARCASFCAPLVVLGYTRSLFHFSWILGVIAAGLIVVDRRPDSVPGERRRRWLVAAGAALLLCAWPAKNALRFGVFSFSSWQGYNVSRDLGVSDPPELTAFRDDGSPPDLAAETQVQALVPARFLAIPALSELHKANGSPNWNHYAIIPLAREAGSRGVAVLRAHPEALLAKAWRTYTTHYTLYPARQPHSRTLVGEERSAAAGRWMRLFEALVLQRPGQPNGFALVLPGVIALALWRACRAWSAERTDAATILFLLSAVLWVAAMALLVDGFESNRMRFSTEPALWTALAWATRRRAGAAATQGGVLSAK